jgi:hypothetical protein
MSSHYCPPRLPGWFRDREHSVLKRRARHSSDSLPFTVEGKVRMAWAITAAHSRSSYRAAR